MWLNLVTSTKLPMYPGEGSSHHVVQHFFFFFWFDFFYVFFCKKGAQCVIVGITTDRTRDGLKGDMGIQPLCHTHNWWHRVRLISPYWYTFKGNGKTSCTLAVLQWVVKLLPRSNPWLSSIKALEELPIDGADPYTIIINQLVSFNGVCLLSESWKYIISNGHMVRPNKIIKV